MMPFHFTKLPISLQQAAHAHLGFIEKATLLRATKNRKMLCKSTRIPTCRKIRHIYITMNQLGSHMTIECYSIEGLIEIICECRWPSVMQLDFLGVGVGDVLMGAGEFPRQFVAGECRHEMDYGPAIKLLNRLFYGARPQASSVNITDYSDGETTFWPENWRDVVQWPASSLELFRRPFSLVSFDFPESLEGQADWLQWSGCNADTVVGIIGRNHIELALELLIKSLPMTRHIVFLVYFDHRDCYVGDIMRVTQAILNRPRDAQQRIIEMQFSIEGKFERAKLEARLQMACSLPPEAVNDVCSVRVRAEKYPLAFYRFIQNAHLPSDADLWRAGSHSCWTSADPIDWRTFITYC